MYGLLKAQYDRVKGADNQVNIYLLSCPIYTYGIGDVDTVRNIYYFHV